MLHHAVAAPDIVLVVVGLVVIGALAVGADLLFRRSPRLLTLAVVFIIALFVILKLDALGRGASAGLRILTGQAVDQASALDLRWLGFSYIAFRLIHVCVTARPANWRPTPSRCESL